MSSEARGGASGFGEAAGVALTAGAAAAASGEAAVLAQLIRESSPVVALTGAGISVPSGIPDFRSPGTGLWERIDPMEVAHIDVFRRDPERFWAFYGQRFDLLDDKQPNRAHLALAALERAGLLDAVITQNIDGLHARAGTRELIEVHGTTATSSCPECGARHPLGEVRARQRAGARGVPRCDCGAPLKPDVVLFGEYLPPGAFQRAEELAADAQLMLCIGTSLEVYPVGELPAITHASGGAVAIITAGETPYDRLAAVRMRSDVVDALESVVGELGIRLDR